MILIGEEESRAFQAEGMEPALGGVTEKQGELQGQH